jgi:hypothetical protein
MDLMLFVLAVPFKSNFFMDILVPALAGVFVLVLILNSLLNHFGYKLF